jgi:NTE family protein
MALVAGTPHTATVSALRDCEIMAMSRQTFFAEARKHPEVMAELARLMILRARQPVNRGGAGRPTVFGFVAVSEGIDARGFAEAVAQEAKTLGFAAAVVGAESAHQPPEWFSRVEQVNDVVLLSAELDET